MKREKFYIGDFPLCNNCNRRVGINEGWWHESGKCKVEIFPPKRKKLGDKL